LNQIGKLHSSYQDTSLKIWLADRSAGNEKTMSRACRTFREWWRSMR
jgi:hypothetical protein